MAFSNGKESTEEIEIKRYIGVAPVFILATNPSKEKLSEIYGRTIDKDPEYVTEKDGVKSARIDFVVKTNKERCGIETITKVTYFLRNEYKYNKDKTKIQVIDKYGRTAWGTVEEIKAKQIPTYSTGNKANIDAGYRPAYVGEEEFTNFMKTFLNIPSISVLNTTTNTWEQNDNPNDCEARFDKIADYFKGDFSEVTNAIKMQPNNQVKILFGVKTTEDNKQYQDVMIHKVLLSNSKNYQALEKTLNERKELGGYPNTCFEVCDLKEYGIEPTTFGSENNTLQPQPQQNDLPW